jgi:hypothetical protein
MTSDPQTEYARRVAKALNVGVLQDAVAVGLEDQGQFEIDALDVLDALESAHLKLTPDNDDEVTQASTALVESNRHPNQP